MSPLLLARLADEWELGWAGEYSQMSWPCQLAVFEEGSRLLEEEARMIGEWCGMGCERWGWLVVEGRGRGAA